MKWIYIIMFAIIAFNIYINNYLLDMQVLLILSMQWLGDHIKAVLMNSEFYKQTNIGRMRSSFPISGVQWWQMCSNKSSICSKRIKVLLPGCSCKDDMAPRGPCGLYAATWALYSPHVRQEQHKV